MIALHWVSRLFLLHLAFALGAAVPAFAAPPNDCDRCFAVIRGNGTVVKQRNVPTVYKNEIGQYFLVFTYSIAKCALTASVDSAVVGSNIRLGLISINRANATGVKIYIYSPSSGGSVTPVDFPFSIVATC